MLGDPPLFDLSQFTFEEFVSFFFDHDIPEDEDWYEGPEFSNFNDFNERGVVSPEIIVQHMTRLFTDFVVVTSPFSPQQINNGIWAMLTYGPFRLQKHLWLPSTPLTQRLDCIRSMYFVYLDFVSKSTIEMMENCYDMWWDQVASSFWEQLHFERDIIERDSASLDEEHWALLNTMFETLSKILALPDRRTQTYGLHGLGHLHHPGVHHLVQTYLDKHGTEFTPEGIAWIERCRDGTVM